MKSFVYAVVFSLAFAPMLPSLEAHANSDSRLERKEDRIREKIKDNKKEIAELRKQIAQVSRDLARCRADVEKLRRRGGGTMKPAPKSEDTGDWGDVKDGKDDKDKFEWGKTPIEEDNGNDDEVANKQAYCDELQTRLDDLKQEERNYKDGIDQYEQDIDDLYSRPDPRPDDECISGNCSGRRVAPNTGKGGWEVFADVLKAATPLGIAGMNTWLGYKGMKMSQNDPNYQLYANGMLANGLPIQPPGGNGFGGIIGSVTGANSMLSMFMNGWGSGGGNMYGGPYMGGGMGMGGGYYPGMGMGGGYSPYGMYGMGSFAAGSAFVSGFAAGGGYSPYGMGMGGGFAPYGMGMGGGFAIGGGFAMGGSYSPYGMYGMGGSYSPYSMGMGGGVGMAPMSIGMGQSFNGFVPYNMGGAYSGGFAPYSMGAGGGYAPYSMGMGSYSMGMGSYSPYSGGYMAYPAGSASYVAGSAFVSGFAAGGGYAPYGQSFVGGSGFGPVPGTYPGYPGGYMGGYPGGNAGSFPYANPMYGVNPSCYGGMCSYNPYMSSINGQYNAGGLPNFYMNQQQQLSAQMRAYQQQGLLGQDALVAQQAMQEAQARYQYVTGQMSGSYYTGGTVGYGGAGYTTPYYTAGYNTGLNNTSVPTLTGTRQ
jgi:hypothetical protein